MKVTNILGLAAVGAVLVWRRRPSAHTQFRWQAPPPQPRYRRMPGGDDGSALGTRWASSPLGLASSPLAR